MDIIEGSESVLLPLGQHPLNTLHEIGRKHCGSIVRVSPFCHEHPDDRREVRGWVLDIPSDAPAHSLPISFNLFDGVTVVQLEISESEVFRMMQKMSQIKKRLSAAVDAIMALDEKKRATWVRCRPSAFPQSLERGTKDKDGILRFIRDDDSAGCCPIIDSDEWSPELSPGGFIGFYHHWHRSALSSRLCMYVVCQSYLPKACLEFADLAHQVSGSCTAGCVCLSEELQWLRSACSRNRCRLIYNVCERMGLRVPTMLDYNACNRTTKMAIPTTETLHHDMVSYRRDTVRVLNYCSETRRAFNGSICVMAPWDGVWIFHGCCRIVDACGDFGTASGDEHLLMPTAAPQVKDRSTFGRTGLTFSVADSAQCAPLQIWTEETRPEHVILVNKVQHTESDGIVDTNGLDVDVVEAFQKIMLEQACPQPFFMPDIPGATPEQATHHLLFDEFVLEMMSQKGWSRVQGMTKLTPMACALYDHWKSKL